VVFCRPHNELKTQSRAVLLALVATLSACASGTNAVFQSMQYAFQKDSSADNAKLNPAYRYLRVVIDGRVALMVLGYVDRHPRGPIEVWYSADREVLRLQNGRIVGAVGLTTEWRNAEIPELPTWSVLAATSAPTRWIRIRDVMPGYRYGIRDQLALQQSPPPARSALQVLNPQNLAWFEERIEPALGESPGTEADSLAVARYAVNVAGNAEIVAYGEQCLASNLCFSWQRWPVVVQSGKSE
jgi:hypothetical protein